MKASAARLADIPLSKASAWPRPGEKGRAFLIAGQGTWPQGEKRICGQLGGPSQTSSTRKGTRWCQHPPSHSWKVVETRVNSIPALLLTLNEQVPSIASWRNRVYSAERTWQAEVGTRLLHPWLCPGCVDDVDDEHRGPVGGSRAGFCFGLRDFLPSSHTAAQGLRHNYLRGRATRLRSHIPRDPLPSACHPQEVRFTAAFKIGDLLELI